MKNHAVLVGLGIFLSRISGLVRERVFAHFFGNSDAGDAFKAALKIPNFLQNLFGEGVLSASFIPVYAELLAKKHEEEAAKVASVVGSLLFLLTSGLVLLGVFCTPWMIELIAPGFSGEKKQLTIEIVRILFPGTGFLVMSAWCLGILNSHKKFFLSYVAPVIWNVAIIAALVGWGFTQSSSELAITVAYGLVVGSFLQFLVQLPTALRLGNKIRPQLSFQIQGVRKIIKNFVPVVFSRGVVQVSAYIDNVLASLLPTGAVSSLAYAQTLYLLPVSLFGMSVSAAELPTMSQAQGSPEEIANFLKQRLNRGLRQICFFIIPSIVGFIFIGDLIVGAVFQTGAFNQENAQFVWYVLAGYSLGLLATTMGRLYASSFYSLKDARTPLKFAIIRVFFSAGLGFYASRELPKVLGLDQQWGTIGLTVAASLATALEFFMLKRASKNRIGSTGVPAFHLFKLWGMALLAAGAAVLVKLLVLNFTQEFHIILRAFLSLTTFGLIYFGLGYLLQIDEAKALVSKILRKLKLSK